MKCNNSSKHRVTSIFERLERYQIKGDGCWGWSGTSDGKGYGALSNRLGKPFSPEKAHRISYEKEFGEIPLGMNVCHSCDNPPCTNPQHLFLGTQQENMADCSKKGRISPKILENLNRRRSMTDQMAAEALRRHKAGESMASIARGFGVHQTTVSNYLKGRRSWPAA
ncbi:MULTISPECIES: HNH endonuclease [Pseudomonas syringae group]